MSTGTKKLSSLTSPKTIGQRILCIRKAWKWTQKDLARALNTKQQVVSHWEQGFAEPSATARVALSGVFGISVQALSTGKGFSIPDLPVHETIQPFVEHPEITRILPPTKKGKVLLMDLMDSAFQQLNQEDASRLLANAISDEREVWLIIQ